MKTVWKYPLTEHDQTLELPAGAKVLSVITQDDVPMLYALVNSGANHGERWEVSVFGTGHCLDYNEEADADNFVGTVTTHGGVFVWHVFASKEGSEP